MNMGQKNENVIKKHKPFLELLIVYDVVVNTQIFAYASCRGRKWNEKKNETTT